MTTASAAIPVPVGPADALAMLDACLDYLAHADAADMPAAVRAECLRGYERASARIVAARSAALRAFTAGQDYLAAGDHGPRPWLKRETRIAGPAAGWHISWARRLAAWPRLREKMADGDLTESVARLLSGWIASLPEDAREVAEKTLLEAWDACPDTTVLAEIYAELRDQLAEPDRDGESFEDRFVRVETTLDGAGTLTGS